MWVPSGQAGLVVCGSQRVDVGGKIMNFNAIS